MKLLSRVLGLVSMLLVTAVLAAPPTPSIFKPQHASHTVLKQVPMTQKAVALTIDLGNTASRFSFGQVFGWIGRHHLKVTWFVTGWFVQRYPDLVAELARTGQELGNHTNTHPSCPELTRAEFKQELLSVEALLRQQGLGITSPKYFRPPFGDTNANVVNTARVLGYRTVMWSATSEDYDLTTDPAKNASAILRSVRPGGIILAHSTLVSAKTIPLVASALQAENYQIVSVNRLVTIGQNKATQAKQQ